ncbi:MAG TPA: hypothetical protein VHE81_03835 [Lacipirellulaceae bacterium]|nr:hypothetical protein [Lacipirellulaceae bacterium]
MSGIFSSAVDPIHSRFWFYIRTFVHFLGCISWCAGIIFVLTLIGVSPWISDPIAIAITLYAYVAILTKQPLKIRCEHCHGYITTNTPWVCGFCGAKNDDVDEYPFVNKCKHCGAPPKAYKCHHSNCGELIYLSEDRLDANFAYCYTRNVEAPPLPRQALRQEEQLEKEHALKMRKIDSDIAALEKGAMPPKLQSVSDQKREKLERMLDAHLSAREWANKKRAEIAIRFKDDPEGLEKANMLIERFLEEEA